MRTLHRWTMTIALLLLGYLAVTGLLLQGNDTLAVINHNSAEIASIRDGSSGPPGYIGMNPPDAGARPLVEAPAVMMKQTLGLAAHVPVGAIELRAIALSPDAAPVSQAVITSATVPAQTIVIATGLARVISSGPAMAPSPGAGGRNQTRHDSIKTWHRGNIIGTPGVALNVLTSLLLALLVISGVVMYLRMLAARGKNNLSGFFWPSGGIWRRLHRLVAICASLFLLTMAISGFLIGFDELMVSLSGGPRMMGPQPQEALPAIPPAALIRALAETEQLAAATHPGQPLLAIKLRSDQGRLQGIIWTDGIIPQPALFDLATGREVTSPSAGQDSVRPLGLPWKWHQIAKRIHRGDLLGLPGRVMDLLTGLSLLFLVVSGGKIYAELWLGRRRLGHGGWFW